MAGMITFGSCLSRHVARSYKRLFGGDIIASVYHNRSDHFLASHLHGTNNQDRLRVLERSVAPNDLDEDAWNIVRNQTRDGLGKHKLDDSPGFFAGLQDPRLKFLLMDNFMDVSARESVGDGCRCFLRPQDYSNYDQHFRLGDYISADQSSANFSAIIAHVQEHAPAARIVFMHFPYNTYEDAQRKQRSLAFVDAFNPAATTVIPPLSVPKIFRTTVPSHFEEPQYAAYAGMIRALTYAM